MVNVDANIFIILNGKLWTMKGHRMIFLTFKSNWITWKIKEIESIEQEMHAFKCLYSEIKKKFTTNLGRVELI